MFHSKSRFIFLISLLAVILIAMVLSSLLSRYYQPIATHVSTGASNITATKNPSYKLAVKTLKEISGEAKRIYLDSIRENKTWKFSIDSKLSKAFILNATIVNETMVFIDDTAYRYVIVSIYDAGTGWGFTPQKISIDNISVELLPRNKSVTYTGGQRYNYLVRVGNATCRAGFVSIGFMEATRYLTIGAERVCDSIYFLKITVASKLGSTRYVSSARLILIKLEAKK